MIIVDDSQADATPIIDGDQVVEKHALSTETRTVVLFKCWSVIFDVRGNAPANATAASFATRELAELALTIFSAPRRYRKKPVIIVGGVGSYDYPAYSVEGYDFDTMWRVVQDWCPEGEILTSLADLADLADCEYDSGLPDGVVLVPYDDEEEETD